MLALSVQFLTGRYTATAHDDRDRCEWPPHPARLFSALADAWGSAEQPDDAERAVLERLEHLGPPQLSAPEAVPRTVRTHYVPVNGRSSHPGHRGKQPRTFPSCTLGAHPDRPGAGVCDCVQYIWPRAEWSQSDRSILDGLLARVARLGHSSSLVNCTLVDLPDEPTHVPSPTPAPEDDALRTVAPGQLKALESEHRRHRASVPRSLPHTRTVYARRGTVDRQPQAVCVPSCAGEWYAFELFAEGAGTRRGIRPEALISLTFAWHAALGARPGCSPRALDGAGLIGLPRVGPHGSGDLLGAAAIIPRVMPDPEKAALRACLAGWLGDEGSVRAGADRVRFVRTARKPLRTLQPGTWGDDPTGHRDWATATPIAVPLRRPRTEPEWAGVESWIADALTAVGLPRARRVSASAAPPLSGTVPARGYPSFQHNGRRMFLTHARIHLDAPVTGPLLLGVGSRLGLGLMKPLRGRHA
ncbi:type I-U CRISPR-associated protein Csb2 [uncultured Propionibacterium sp.]|uniref:type I-G CRISPR-associated protein Csb2 n=1 Tax=uncultured Propionibacterium sp. TaxID=218066 RepID=UPI002931E26E|nr:type I-U CRISPR-associated protein Csb2 [uncultured Propionibacterium sp.]